MFPGGRTHLKSQLLMPRKTLNCRDLLVSVNVEYKLTCEFNEAKCLGAGGGGRGVEDPFSWNTPGLVREDDFWNIISSGTCFLIHMYSISPIPLLWAKDD